MANESERLRTKVFSILRREKREDDSSGKRSADCGAIGKLQKAILIDFREDLAFDIAFHLSDWCSDAAFLVAVSLYPDEFTDEEVNLGFYMFIIHAPNHVAAAAKLAGHPVQDIFGVDALSEHDGRPPVGD